MTGMRYCVHGDFPCRICDMCDVGEVLFDRIDRMRLQIAAAGELSDAAHDLLLSFRDDMAPGAEARIPNTQVSRLRNAVAAWRAIP